MGAPAAAPPGCRVGAGPARRGPRPRGRRPARDTSARQQSGLPSRRGASECSAADGDGVEAVERRAEAKENANRCRTCRTQCRESVSPRRRGAYGRPRPPSLPAHCETGRPVFRRTCGLVRVPSGAGIDGATPRRRPARVIFGGFPRQMPPSRSRPRLLMLQKCAFRYFGPRRRP